MATRRTAAEYAASRRNVPAQVARPPVPAVQRAPPSPDDVYLPVSLLMDKEIITRTSGKRLGYIHQVYVDAVRLEVVAMYMRQSATSLGATSTDHVLLSSLRQIGDVVLVHDESALLDPPADESYGCYRIIGTEVQTEDGNVLGKVRDYVFNPDNGQLMSIRYDALGIMSIPEGLLSCYSLNWEDVIAIGPTKTIVRRGSELRAVKEAEGWISEYVNALVSAIAGDEEEYGTPGLAGSDNYRSDPAYAAWYQQHATEYERYYGQKLPRPIIEQPPQPVQAARPPAQRQRRPAPPPAGRPRALPPPTSLPYSQAVQPQQQQQQRRPVPRAGPEPMLQGVGPAGGAAPRMQQQQQGMPPPSRQGMPPRQPPPQQPPPQNAPRSRPAATAPPPPGSGAPRSPPPTPQQQQAPPSQ